MTQKQIMLDEKDGEVRKNQFLNTDANVASWKHSANKFVAQESKLVRT